MYKKISGLVVSLTAVFACAAWAEVPAGHPADYQETIDAAAKEGQGGDHSTTDTKAAGPFELRDLKRNTRASKSNIT
ncbi:hypothetical protein LNQ52_22805 [Klebsiella pneumoniae subsp. pneumoniae]|nr:hypothetical protein [Klebsiella pneumoniae subsp. pneumoniae]